jgi:putative endonuclease
LPDTVNNPWHVYMLLCADDTLYTGVALDPQRRLLQHNGERAGGPKYTRGRRPVRLIWSAQAADRGAALQREAAIKKLRRSEKLQLIDAQVDLLGLK